MTYRRMLYIFVIIKRNHFKMHMFGVVGETHAHDYFEVILFSIIAKIYNILRYVIPQHMCNLHIKENEISQKRSKGIKNWKITYSVILSVLSNKTNLILGFSSLLNNEPEAFNFRLIYTLPVLQLKQSLITVSRQYCHYTTCSMNSSGSLACFRALSVGKCTWKGFTVNSWVTELYTWRTR